MLKENIITVDIGASKIRFMAVNENKELTEYLDTPPVSLVGRKLTNPDLIKILADNIRLIIHDVEKEGNIVSAAGIGSPGPLDPVKGIIQNPPNLKGIRNLAVVDELKEIFNFPVFLLNDADASLLGECWLRENKKLKNVVYLTLSSGVGSGILKNGKLVTGTELGHKELAGAKDKRICSCGETDHAEAYLGTAGLAETYAKIFGIKPDSMNHEEPHSVSPKMRKGVADNDPKWLAIQDKYAEHLALFLKNILDQFNPEIIILGGGIIFYNKPLLAEAKKKLKVLDSSINENIVELAESANNVNLGAAWYAFDRLDLAEKVTGNE